jgi:hypothetical protein
MRDADGKPRVCDGAWISYYTGRGEENGEGFGKLTAGYGSRPNPSEDGGKIGPEFTFGITMDETFIHPSATLFNRQALHYSSDVYTASVPAINALDAYATAASLRSE